MNVCNNGVRRIVERRQGIINLLIYTHTLTLGAHERHTHTKKLVHSHKTKTKKCSANQMGKNELYIGFTQKFIMPLNR